MDRFPRTPSELTPEWLGERLRAAETLPAGVDVVGLEVESLSADVGIAGELVRVRLRYVEPSDALSTLVAKFSTTNERNLEIMLRYGLYRREVEFYRGLARQLPIRVPRCYATDLSEDGRACLLLLEDLGTWRTGDQVESCNLEEARSVIAQIARLHAAFHGQEARADGVWRADGAQAKAKIASVAISWESARDNLGERLPSALVAAVPAYLEALPRILGWAAQGMGTLVHGDLRLDNVLFGGTGRGVEIAIVDWQNCQWGNGLLDVAYFMTQSLPVGLRRAEERSLLSGYAAQLRAAGIEVTDDAVHEDYRRAALSVLSTAITLAGLSMSGGRGADLADAVVGRAVAAVDDLDLLQLLA